MIEVSNLERQFSIEVNGDNIVLEDINAKLSVEDIKELYTTQYPQLVNASVDYLGVVNDRMSYKFTTYAGTKG